VFPQEGQEASTPWASIETACHLQMFTVNINSYYVLTVLSLFYSQFGWVHRCKSELWPYRFSALLVHVRLLCKKRYM